MFSTVTRTDDIIFHFLYGTDYMHTKSFTFYCKHRFGAKQSFGLWTLFVNESVAVERSKFRTQTIKNTSSTCVAFPEIETGKVLRCIVQRAKAVRQKRRVSTPRCRQQPVKRSHQLWACPRDCTCAAHPQPLLHSQKSTSPGIPLGLRAGATDNVVTTRHTPFSSLQTSQANSVGDVF